MPEGRHRRLLSDPGFPRFFASQAVSLLGDGIAATALTLALVAGGHGPVELGAVLAAAFVPRLALVVGGGVWADRLPKPWLIAGSAVCRAAAQLGTAALLLDGGSVPSIVACQVVYGAAAAFSQPATAGYLPALVPEERLAAANGLLGAWDSLAYVVGPAVAGAIAALGGAPLAVALDGISFVVSAVLVVRLPDPVAGRPALSGPRAVAEGWRAVHRRGWLLHEAIASATVICFTSAPFLVVGAALVAGRYGGPAWAAVATAFGLGQLAGSAFAGRVEPGRPLFASAPLVAVLALSPAALAVGAGPAVLAATELASGAALAAYGVWLLTTIQRHVPGRVLARVMALSYVGSFSGFPLGMALGPIAAARLGAGPVLAFGSAWAVLAAASMLANPGLRRLRAADRAEAPAGLP